MSEDVLVLNISGIGDFVDSTPALALLRTRRPKDRLVLVVAEKTLPLARTCPHVDEVVGMPTRPGRGIPRLVDLPRWLATIYSWRRRFALVVSLYGVSSGLGHHFTKWLLRWIGAAVSVGREGGVELFTLRLAESEAPRDLVESYLELASLVPSVGASTSPAGIGADENNGVRSELWLPEAALNHVGTWLAGQEVFGSLDGPLVVAALGGDRPSRRESPDRAERWLVLLQREFGIRPVIWGTRGDPGVSPASTLCHVDARGRWDLVHSAALISLADVVITTQSVAQHLVSVWDVPTLVLVGPADPLKHRPHLETSPLRLLQREVPCAPCYHHECPLPGGEYKKCLNRIAPEDVVEAFRDLMKEGTRKS